MIDYDRPYMAIDASGNIVVLALNYSGPVEYLYTGSWAATGIYGVANFRYPTGCVIGTSTYALYTYTVAFPAFYLYEFVKTSSWSAPSPLVIDDAGEFSPSRTTIYDSSRDTLNYFYSSTTSKFYHAIRTL
jgi:hypothetical protein